MLTGKFKNAFNYEADFSYVKRNLVFFLKKIRFKVTFQCDMKRNFSAIFLHLLRKFSAIRGEISYQILDITRIY